MTTMGDTDRAGTRSRIQDVSLDLFAGYGYDKTSLREIADRLGMTKAALYYHFRSKDDIIASLVDDLVSGIDELVKWTKNHTSTPWTRRELIGRYARMVRAQDPRVMRFVLENQPAMRDHNVGITMFSRLQELSDFMSNAADPLPLQLCHRMALLLLHCGPVMIHDVDASHREIVDTALEAALSMVSDHDHPAGPTARLAAGEAARP